MFKSFRTSLSFIFIALFAIPTQAAADTFKIFETKYTQIHYLQDEDMQQFLWRIGGKRIDVYTYPGFAKSRVDRIVEKVQSLLDMYPEDFKIAVYLRPQYEKGHIAFYRNENQSVVVYADRVTDNVFAHEISHAVINSYFESPPSSKVKEILSQYVDVHLWE
ncbi:hypothetical protein OAA99_00915 [Omnitrophica bacterium]|nr:hypothetical protein [Candidatus Omnitrophota bacterium]